MLPKTGQRVVGEGVDVVEIEAGPFGSVIYLCEIAAQVGAEPRATVLIAELRAEDALVLQIAHEVVVHLGRGEGHVGERCIPLIAGTNREHMAMACVPRHGALAATVEESGLAALAIGVLGEETVLHLAVALNARAANLAVEGEVEAAHGCRIVGPGVSLVGIDVVVVAELVALTHRSVGMVQVVLHPVGVGRIVAHSVGINVVEVFCSQQIVHRLIVHTLVGGQHESCIPIAVLCFDDVERGSESEIEVVVVTCLNVVHGVTTQRVGVAVGPIEAVPLYLAVLLVILIIVHRTLPVPVG